MDKTTLTYLIGCGIFSNTNYVKTMRDAIDKKEILMSRKILENGWNIGSLFQLYDGVDFRFINKKPSDYNFPFLNDIMKIQHRNSMWNEYQLVFIKGNRNIMNNHTTGKNESHVFGNTKDPATRTYPDFLFHSSRRGLK